MKRHSKKPMIIAHRGGFGPHRENTLEAFQHALANGVSSLEMDARYDYFRRRFFLEHDFFHHPKSRLNVFSPVLKGIPKDIFLIIEIKSARFFTSFFYVRDFVRFYKENLCDRPVLLQSFNLFALKRLRKMLPDAQLGFLCANPFWNILFKRILWEKIRPQYYLLHQRVFNRWNVGFGKKHHMQIFSFVFNKPAEWDKALHLDVDGIITDRPTQLQDYLHHHVKT